MPDALLTASGVQAGYRTKQILFGLDFEIAQGEVVALLGANGSGKSTALNTVSGFVRPSAGSIRFDGQEIAGLPPHKIFKRGIIQVSQARDLFPDMTVEDNLKLGAWVRGSAADADLDAVCASFPRLAERRRQAVGLMSGGEQQMVAIGRALMGQPKLLLLDEPSGGLAPAVRRRDRHHHGGPQGARHHDVDHRAEHQAGAHGRRPLPHPARRQGRPSPRHARRHGHRGGDRPQHLSVTLSGPRAGRMGLGLFRGVSTRRSALP